MTHPVEITNATKRFGDKTALESLALLYRRGRLSALSDEMDRARRRCCVTSLDCGAMTPVFQRQGTPCCAFSSCSPCAYWPSGSG
jgi:hypothetical protein